MQKPNPDIYCPVEVPQCLRAYVRRALVADTVDFVDMTVDIRATGYHYLGWVWRGRWQGIVNGEVRFDSDTDGAFHVSGQMTKSNVVAKMQRNIGQIFLEFTALGHFQLLGITGVRLFEDAGIPYVLNSALQPHFKSLFNARNGTPDARMEVLADALHRLPKYSISDGIITAVERMEEMNGAIQISKLVTGLGLAERKFRTDFKELIGLTPKTFCKTLQINQALNQLVSNNKGDLADIASQSGFSDQAHFTRAFSDFLGRTPGNYLDHLEITLARFVGQSRQSD